jgi:diguanylate cyclase
MSSIDKGLRDRPALESAHAVFVDRLIRLIGALAPEADDKETKAFQAKLEDYRKAAIDPTRQMEVPRITESCLITCQQYFKLSKKYLQDREAEYTEIISILRDAAKVTIGDSSEFNAQVLASSERFGRLAHVDDVRVLKQHLVQEVVTLRHTVEEKQKRDERAYNQLTGRVEMLQAKLEAVEAEASLDGLTRIANRAQFNRVFARTIDQARDKGTPVAFAMLDIDNFKHINDTHGHPIGDRVLVCAAQWLTRSIRQTDFVARYGGEEFAVVLPNATAAQVEDRLVKLLEDVASSSYEYELLGKKEKVRFTLSCGLADLHADETGEEFIQRTDEALYEAKKTGKNKVVCRKKKGLKSLLGWGS